MPLIINPRGIGGSGKTELVRRIMQEYGWTAAGAAEDLNRVVPLFKRGRELPIGYCLRHPAGHRPLAVLGHYERTCGGCDTIPLTDGGLAAVFELAGDYASRGHDVLIEGLHLSKDTDSTARLAQQHPLHVLHLDIPPEASARNLVRRRRAARHKVTLMVNSAIAERETVVQACEWLRPHAQVHRLGFDDALATTRQLLSLA